MVINSPLQVITGVSIPLSYKHVADIISLRSPFSCAYVSIRVSSSIAIGSI